MVYALIKKLGKTSVKGERFMRSEEKPEYWAKQVYGKLIQGKMPGNPGQNSSSPREGAVARPLLRPALPQPERSEARVFTGGLHTAFAACLKYPRVPFLETSWSCPYQ